MIKLISLSLLPMIFFPLNAMQQRMLRKEVMRVEHRTEFTDNTKISQYFEVGYNHENGHELQERHVVIHAQPRNSATDILSRNFINSKTAFAGLALLAAAFFGLTELEAQKTRMQGFNETTMCPSPQYYNFKENSSALALKCYGLAGAGVALCCMQCIKTGVACCCEYAEHEE